jgi:uncharacterized protein
MKVDHRRYGPWALITGASSGIGEEFARQAAASGLNVVLIARREQLLEQLRAELTATYGVQARVVAADLTRDGLLDTLAPAIGDLDIGLVVSNAGSGNPGEFLSIPRQRLREVVNINVLAHLDLAHHFGQKLAQRRRGGIVLVSAAAAAGGLPYMANDSATKAYVLNLGEALHAELRPAGIHVTVLVPVLVATPVLARMGIDRARLPITPMPVAQCVEQTLEALDANQPTTITRAQMVAALDGMKANIVHAISQRTAAGDAAH